MVRPTAAAHDRRRRGHHHRLSHRPRPEVDVRSRRRRYTAVAVVRRPTGIIRRHGDRGCRTRFVARVSSASRRRRFGRRRRLMAVAVVVVAATCRIGRARKSACTTDASGIPPSPSFDGRPASSTAMAAVAVGPDSPRGSVTQQAAAARPPPAAAHGHRRRGRRRRPPHRPRPEVDAHGRHRRYAAVAAGRRPVGVIRRHGDHDRMAGSSVRASNLNRRRQLGRRRRPMATIAVFQERPRLLPPHDARRRHPLRLCAEAGVAFGGVVITATAPRERRRPRGASLVLRRPLLFCEEATAPTTTRRERGPLSTTHRAVRASRRRGRAAAKRHVATSAVAKLSRR